MIKTKKTLIILTFLFAILLLSNSAFCIDSCDLWAGPAYQRYCDWSGCNRDNYCCGPISVRTGGKDGCESRCEDYFKIQIGYAKCSKIGGGDDDDSSGGISDPTNPIYKDIGCLSA